MPLPGRAGWRADLGQAWLPHWRGTRQLGAGALNLKSVAPLKLYTGLHKGRGTGVSGCDLG